MKKLIQLLIVVLIAHAGWRVGPVYWRYVTFRDHVSEAVKFSGARPEDELLDRIVELAAAGRVPVAREAVQVRRVADHTYLDLAYVEPLELLPRYFYPYEFKISVDAWHVKVPEPMK